MSIKLERPPQTELRKEWADWFNKLWAIVSGLEVPTFTDATRGDSGRPGRVIFNSDDGTLNIDDGTQWIDQTGAAT